MMRRAFITLALLSPAAAAQSTLPYRDATLPVERRVQDLLSRMTLQEKVGQMTQIDTARLMGRDEWDRGPLNPEWMKRVLADQHVGSLLSGGGVAPIPNTPSAWAEMTNTLQRFALEHSRLGIPILYGADAVHGHNNVVGAPIFPHNLGLAATFDPSLVESIGVVTANALRATGVTWNFAPDADLGVDPRWGRFYETWGDLPELAAAMVAASVRGQQGDFGPQNVATTLKHFVGYGAPQGGKDRADAIIADADLRSSHLPPFEAGLKAGALSVMVNSGSVNGVPAHASAALLTKLLRQDLGFTGVTISDWEDVKKLQTVHKVAASYRDAVKMALTAGVDVSMVPHDAEGFTSLVLDLVKSGDVPQARIDEAAGRVLAMKFRLGLFERPYVDASGAAAAVGAGRDLAAKAARASITLLANDGVLPLGRSGRRVLIVGERARDPRSQLGGWTIGWQGMPANEDTPSVTVLDGMKATLPKGAALAFSNDVPSAPNADVIVVVVGEPPHAEGDADNPTLGLPSSDVDLLRSAVRSGKKVVAVLLSGRPVVLPDDVRTKLSGLVMAYLPGSEGGRAIADVLYGNTNPSGRLPFTWPSGAARSGAMYSLGFGLSYTTFTESTPTVDKGVLNVTVSNTGKIAGTRTVLAFGRANNRDTLAAFGKVTLAPGETRRVTLPLLAGTPANSEYRTVR
ncbi:glycoside hydrolase family 3 protein [Deinococcus yavapaiensis]|uniref:beta-glucosidase n=1 Tax=Deinococcus yavapaiensis KR-236 TaxID=694435 RepID=A0A318SCU7_9DEIO|nr:glycoside hydrolase family 3 N-terminal domain-containing protein [Deinococcus yavapaiensis]PYE54628.1 beta-glucosidase [Deinococcus yavapaiensis KR-236]